MDESEIKEILASLGDSNDSAMETLTQLGWSVTEYSENAGDFDIGPFEDLIQGVTEVIVVGFYGGMITFHAFTNDGSEIIDYFDVDDTFETLDPTVQNISLSISAILTALGITVSTKVGETEGQQFTFTEDELIIATRIGVGGGKPFKMPKPLNWKLGLPIKKAIIDNLKARM